MRNHPNKVYNFVTAPPSLIAASSHVCPVSLVVDTLYKGQLGSVIHLTTHLTALKAPLPHPSTGP
ncbi:hypothetical protein J6590_011593 [Homalodisca vitripennis]|nr:hypothetical protein J6590_011593 [Homalodisca vitripennis]